MHSFIVDGCRTPIGKLKGALSNVRADDLASIPIKTLHDRYINHKIDDVILGCANQAGEDNRNVARMALLLAGLPYTVPGETVNRLCASGMSAIIHACRAIANKDGDIFVSGGIEHMTRAPWVISKASSAFGGDAQMYDSSFGWRFINPNMRTRFGVDSMGETAENLAEKYNIDRERQDIFAFNSQMKASNAQKCGRLEKEIIGVSYIYNKEEHLFSQDEFIKPSTTMDALAKLKPAFRLNGTVTAGNASGLNDGSAAVLICSESVLGTFPTPPLARIVCSGVVGVEPKIMGIGPVEASRLVLKKANLSLDKIDIIEINEAFAVQVLACLQELGIEDNDLRINPNGGSIALGHPLGMTGTRILYSAALELNIRNLKYALVSMCVGVGQGYAVILENPNI